MPVTDITKDVDNRRLTITAEFAAPVERVWSLYEDARQLEQVWGPPEYPATFVSHELRPGSRSTYYMTSPEGERFGGYWDVTGVEAPGRFTFDDGFATAELEPNPDLPVSHNTYTFEPTDGGTTATYTSTFESAEALQKVLDMGVEEGSRSAIDQIDAFLAAG
ncbi:MAG: SRPBCC domain-containing protein [Micrococcales bacterium]|nr:SRPBCC domain-containing protein [Micrococcales bacterium]